VQRRTRRRPADPDRSWLRGSGEGIYGIRGDGDTLRITVPAERRDGLITTIPLDFA